MIWARSNLDRDAEENSFSVMSLGAVPLGISDRVKGSLSDM